jgi:hypothetical protein
MMQKAVLLALFTVLILPLFAAGAPEEAALPPQYAEWTVCITALDVSSLPPNRQILGNTLARRFNEALQTVASRQRSDEELNYYQTQAWNTAISAAALQLSTKRSERDSLFFQGNPSWKYQSDLKKKDTEIASLEEAYQKILEEKPEVSSRPAVRLSASNGEGLFPAPPEAGGEEAFCREQKVDALITGSVSEYFDRLYVTLNMWTLSSQAWVYEDSVLFSPGDLETASAEIASRLCSAVSDEESALLTVRTSPADARIMIDGSFVSEGSLDALQRPPGAAELSVQAEGFKPEQMSVDLAAGKTSEFDINLQQEPLYQLNLDSVNGPASVYQGSLYLGQTPLSISLPLSQSELFQLEGNGKVSFAAFPSLLPLSDTGVASVNLNLRLPEKERSVEELRTKFYNAYGRLWIALPVSILFMNIFNTMSASWNTRGVTNTNQAYYDRAQVIYWIDGGLWVLTAAFGIESVVRSVIYLNEASNRAPKIK